MTIAENKPPAGFGFVYLIRAPSGKGYVGQTRVAIVKRWSSHIRTRSCACVHRAFLKYGPENMVVTVLGCYPADQLDEMEVKFVAEYGTLTPAGYNLTAGGQVNKVFSDESRAKMAEAQRRRFLVPVSRETRLKISEAVRKRPPATAEARAKLSAANRGKVRSAETRAKISAIRRCAPPPSPETCAKIAAAHRGRRFSAEVREKVSAAKRGWCPNAETRKNMSAAQKKRFSDPAAYEKLCAGSAKGRDRQAARRAAIARDCMGGRQNDSL